MEGRQIWWKSSREILPSWRQEYCLIVMNISLSFDVMWLTERNCFRSRDEMDLEGDIREKNICGQKSYFSLRVIRASSESFSPWIHLESKSARSDWE